MTKKAELINKRLYLITLDKNEKFTVRVFNDCYETDKNYSIKLTEQTYYLRKDQAFYSCDHYGLGTKEKHIEVIKNEIKINVISRLQLLLSKHIKSCQKISDKIRKIEDNL